MATADPTGAPGRPRSRKRRHTTPDALPRRSRKRRPPAAPDLLDTFEHRPRHSTHPAATGAPRHQPPAEHPPTVWRDARGYVRAPATMPEFHKGRAPSTKGQTFPRNPPTIGESVRLVNACEDTPMGRRRRALYILLWRTGMRVSEALALYPEDLHETEGAIVIRRGKGGKRRVVGMDTWGWQQLKPWIAERRAQYPPGPLFCVLEGPTAGRAWNYSCVNRELKRLARRAGVNKRIAPHQLRHAYAVERKREGVPVEVIQQQLGHANAAMTYRYIGELDDQVVVDAARSRKLPQVPVNELMDMLATPPS